MLASFKGKMKGVCRMAKIIDFKKAIAKKMGRTQMVDLYYAYYKTASEQEKEWTIQMISYDLTKTLSDKKHIKILLPQEVMELYGVAAAKRQLKTPEANASYFRKLSEIIEKYGEEVLVNVKTN